MIMGSGWDSDSTSVRWAEQTSVGSEYSYTWEINDFHIQQQEKLKKWRAIEKIKDQPFYK